MNKTCLKIGWLCGWAGSFCWVVVLAFVFFCKDMFLQGGIGALLAIIGYVFVLLYAPWQYPDKPLWILMVIPYCIFFISVSWAIWAFSRVSIVHINWWDFLWMIPLLTPIGILGSNKWSDYDKH
mgnify:FL=1